MNSSGFPFLFPPAPPLPPPLANHARHPTRSTPVATMLTVTKAWGGKAPLPMARSISPAGTPTAQPFAAAIAAGPTFVPCV